MTGTAPAERRDARRRSTPWVWVLSLVGALVLGALASRRMPLWPDRWVLPEPRWLVAGVAAYVPYVWLRSVRLRLLLDPLARDAGVGRLPATLLHGSGLVSFLVVMALPLRLGELSRPLLITRGRVPGVGFAEAASAVAAERALDGIAVVGLLFVGLAVAPPRFVESMAHVRSVGQVTGAIMVVGLAILLAFSRAPRRLEALVAAVIPGSAEHGAAARLARFAGRAAAALAPVWRPRVAGPLLTTTVAYWAVTVVQAHWVAAACGLELSLAASAVVVAVVGLSIQLPGGPAQLGSFQLGIALALGLYVVPDAHPGAVSFGVAMYSLGLGGSVLAALPGAWLLRRHARSSASSIE